MIKNNFFDKNQSMNDNICCSTKNSIPKNPSFPVNLEILSSGNKSDLDLVKVGSDTRSYFEYHN